MANEPSVYLEICEVSKQLDLIRKDIEAQRFEISKCESIIKPYQLAMTALNNSLNQLMKTKSLLKEKKIKLLNIISNNSDSDDEQNLQIPTIKGEMCENSTTESLVSFSYNSINESNGNQTNAQFRPPEEVTLNNHSTPLKRSFVNCQEISKCNESVTQRKRKRSNSTSSTKKTKSRSDIPAILEFQNRNLSKVVKVSSDVLVSGDKGLLQLRSLNDLNVIRRYAGHEGVVSHIMVTNRNRKQVILSSCGVNLIVFDLITGKSLFHQVFGCEITYLSCINDVIYIGLKSGSVYSFCLNKFSCIHFEKIVDSFVQSSIQIKSSGRLLHLMGCENGSIYLPKTSQSDPRPVIKNDRRNIYDLILLPGGSYILSFSDKTIDLYNKNTLQRIPKSSQQFEEEIRKVAINDKNLYVLFSKGSVYVYQIKKSLPIFSKYQKFETNDVTLKDIHVNDDNALLIGNENLYLWKF